MKFRDRITTLVHSNRIIDRGLSHDPVEKAHQNSLSDLFGLSGRRDLQNLERIFHVLILRSDDPNV